MIPNVADRYWLQLLGCRTPPKRLPEALSDRPARGDALQILNGVAHGPTRSLTSEESMSDENKMNFAPSTTSARLLTTESKRTSSNHWPTRCRFAVCAVGVHVEMIGLSEGTQDLIVAGLTDMRHGLVGLSGLVQTAPQQNSFSGQVFVFRGRRADLTEVLGWDGDELGLLAKCLERGHFVCLQASNGTVSLAPAQLSMLLASIDWRRTVRSWAPQMAALRSPLFSLSLFLTFVFDLDLFVRFLLACDQVHGILRA